MPPLDRLLEQNSQLQDRVVALVEQNELLTEDVSNLERELRKYRAENKRLRKEQDHRLQNDLLFDDAQFVLAHWKKVCHPSAKELKKGPRVENCLARLHGGYSVAELCRCCDGYALKPYVVNGRRTHEGPKDEWRADAELIFRDPQHVDAGLAIAERGDDLRMVFAEQTKSGNAPAPPKELSPFGQAALRLARRGLLVFPCKRRSKAPATRHGLRDAKTDLEAIEACWATHPELNVAVATGALSGVVVLDVDGDVGWDSLHDLEDHHDTLPDTKSLTTPSGGQHFWFKHPGVEIRNTAGFPGPGLDIRGDGGYVLVPPSVGPNDVAYAVDDESPPVHMPSWLVELLRRYQAKVDQALTGTTDWPKFLNSAPSQGERDTRMTRYVGHLFGHGMDAREAYATAALLNALSKPPMDDKQLAKIVQSIARRDRR
jgi:regulator of replication initiation timing